MQPLALPDLRALLQLAAPPAFRVNRPCDESTGSRRSPSIACRPGELRSFSLAGMEKEHKTAEQQFLAAVGKRLASHRRAVGMSTLAVAKELELSKGAVNHWELGKNPVGLDKLFRMARMYRTTVVALVAGDELSNADLVALMNQRLKAAQTPPSGPEAPSPAPAPTAKSRHPLASANHVRRKRIDVL
jgi:transcriptional regulator with XRE-family HTH domain